MTVNAVNGVSVSSLSAVNGVSAGSLTAINGLTLSDAEFDHIGTSLSGSDGSDITFWADSSSAANDLTNSDTATNPVVKAAFLNGLNVSDWTTKGAGRHMLLDVDVDVQEFTYIAVMRCSVSTAAVPCTLLGLGASSRGGASGSGPQVRIYQSKINVLKQNVANIGSSSTSMNTSDFYTVGVTYSSPDAAFYLNGSADGTASSAQTFTNPFRTQGEGHPGEDFTGYIAEDLLWSRVLNGTELTAVFGILQARWGHY